MTRLTAFFSLFLAAFAATAQYDGPAVDACRAYAEKEAAREGQKGHEVVIARDGSLFFEPYGRKLGSQPVSAVLTGNGAVVFDDAPSAELAFICLLADEKRPVFFNWLPRQNVSSLVQCTRDEALRAEPRACLEVLMRVAEADLTQIYAQRFQEANQQGEAPLAAFRKSNDEWREYRSAECARRRELAPKDVSAEDYELACQVDLTRRRGLDVR